MSKQKKTQRTTARFRTLGGAGIALLAVILVAAWPFAGLASTFLDDTQAEFDSGTYANTAWVTDHVQLSGGQTSGTYTSQVFDGGSLGTPTWDMLAWSENLPSTQKIMAVDTAADVWKSTDNAVTWTLAADNYNGATADTGNDGIAVNSGKNVFIVRDQAVRRSTDFGVTWSTASADYNGAEAQNAAGLAITSTDHLFVPEAGEDVWRSTDNGSTWAKQATNFNGASGAVLGFTASGSSLFAVDAAADVWTSTDGAVTWIATNTDYNGADADGGSDGMASDGSGRLYIVRDQKVWRSTNGGVTWTNTSSDYNGGEAQDGTAITADVNGLVFIADADEDIWQSTDNGVSWTKAATNMNGANGDVERMTTFSVTVDLTIQVRSGATDPLSGGFVGPNGTNGTVFTTPSGQAMSVPDARYFQYRASFSTEDKAVTPTLSSVTVTYTAGSDTTPPVISSIASGTPGETTATIVWTTDEAATSQVDYGPTVSYGSSTTLDPSLVTSHSVALTGLSLGTTYHYRVRSKDASDNEAMSSDQTFATADATPPVVSGIVVSGITQTSAVVTWSTDEPATTKVDYGTTSGSYPSGTTLDPLLVTSHSATLTGLTTNTTYFYVVVSNDASANETTSSERTLTTLAVIVPPDTVPPTITDVVASGITTAVATIGWTTNEAATSQVEYGLTPAYGTTTPLAATLLTSHSVALSSLSSGTLFHYRVRSVDGAGNEALSSDATFTTAAAPSEPPPETPPVETPTTIPVETPVAVGLLGLTDLIISSITETQALFIWTTNRASDSHVGCGTTSGVYPKTVASDTLVTSHRIVMNGLAANTTYFCFVASSDGGGERVTSGEAKFTTEASAPKPPGSPGTTNPTPVPGGTVTGVPLLPTAGDTVAPTVAFPSTTTVITAEHRPSIDGTIADALGVIAGLAASFDGGGTWHPVTSVDGIGTKEASFTYTLPYLEDGNYDVMVRAFDNSGNEGRSVAWTIVIDTMPPSVGASVALSGAHEVAPDAAGTSTTFVGARQTLAFSMKGGPVSVALDAVPVEDRGSRERFVATFLPGVGLWRTTVVFSSPGVYDLRLDAVDGADHTTRQTLRTVTVSPAGRSIASDSNTALSNATVALYRKNEATSSWESWTAGSYGQENPIVSDANGTYGFFVPAGTYYVDVRHWSYRESVSQILSLPDGGYVSGDVVLEKVPGFTLGSWNARLPKWFAFVKQSTIATTAHAVEVESFSDALLNTPAPEISLTNTRGETVRSIDVRGKNVVLTFWNTWDPVSQEQLSTLDALSRTKAVSTTFLPIAIQENTSVVSTYLRRGGYSLPSLVDESGGIAATYPLRGLPQHFFIDRKGFIRAVVVGVLDAASIEERLRQL